jgi:hypothetical protein
MGPVFPISVYIMKEVPGNFKYKIQLVLPLYLIYNNGMLDQKDKQVLISDVEHSMSELYWTYRDDLSDEGGKRLQEELDYLKTHLINILEKYPA